MVTLVQGATSCVLFVGHGDSGRGPSCLCSRSRFATMLSFRAAGLVLLLGSAGTALAGPVLPRELFVAVGPVGDPNDPDPEAPSHEPAALFVVDPVAGDRRILSGRGIGAGPEFNEAGDVTVSHGTSG